MELSEAYSVLGLSSDASATERLNVFRSQRERLESRLASAPTAALKEKYRRAIEKLEEAYEVIDLNEAGEDLPIIRPQLGTDSVREPSESQPAAGNRNVKDAEGAGNSSGRESARVSKSGRSGGDFLSMVFIILLILGVGGGAYWYMAVYKPANDRLGTVVAGQLSELEVALDALDRREQALERDLRNLEQRERDIQRDGSADEQSFYGQWRTSQEGYLRWYGDFNAGHPARALLKTAQQLQATDLRGASEAAKKGLEAIVGAAEQAGSESYLRVGQNLINWVLEPQRTGPESYLIRIRNAHPEWISESLTTLMDSLSDLEKASPLPENVDEGLRRIRLVQGAPHQSWEAKVSRVHELEDFLERSVVPIAEWDQYQNSISELEDLTGSASVQSYLPKLTGFKSTVSDLKAKLAGLENRQASSRDVEAVSQLREWVGENDPDYRRYSARLNSYFAQKTSIESRLDDLLSGQIVPVSGWGEINQLIGSLETHSGATAAQRYRAKLEQAKNRLASLKAGLSHLDSGSSKEGDGDRLQALAMWVGQSDPDYLRWKARLMPFGKNITVQTAGIEMIWVNPGSFLMGSPGSEADRGDDETRHRVELTEGYWLGKYEVTQSQWQSVMGSSPSKFSGGRKPVEQVSWEDCVSFCQRLTERERQAGRLLAGYEYGLPTEAQWEYACRAGTTTATAFGNSLSSRQANFFGDSPYGGASKGPYLKRTSDVGSYQPNGWGFYDMHGNVYEWCHDWYGSYGGDVSDPTGPPSGSYRVLRGGSWSNNGRYCRSALRFRSSPSDRHSRLGFRVSLRSKLE